MSFFPEATSFVEDLLPRAATVEQREPPARKHFACGVLASDDRRRGRELLDNVPEVDELGHVDLCEGLAVERSIEQFPHLRRPVTKTHDGESGAFCEAW